MASHPSLPSTSGQTKNDSPPRPTSKDNSSSASSIATLNNSELTPRSCNDKRKLCKARISSWLADCADPQPRYRHDSSSASMVAHTKDIIMFLEDFDKRMIETG
ncbi:hypothetical protein BDZ45DRAFT_71668 [Acephala macrosclerotiorum]|nr:hypothetical protein BDZ45DRAFT_71668 [Acephala macrosclerotiorum]